MKAGAEGRNKMTNDEFTEEDRRGYRKDRSGHVCAG